MRHGTISTERRKDSRKRPLSLVYVELSATNGGMLRDLSEVGFAMRAMMPLRVGEITPFLFSLDEATRLQGQCKVLWVEEDGRVAGLQFTEVPGNLRAQVREWLGEKQMYVSPPPPPAPAASVSQASTMDELREELRTVVARVDAPERDELPLPELQSETATELEEIHAGASFVGESTPAELLEELHARSAPEPDEEAAPVLDSLPLLDPLPGVDGTEFTSNAAKPAPWLSGATISLAVRILLVLAMVAVGVVFHRPIGNAIVWLGLKIAGEEAPEIVPTPRSQNSPAIPGGANNLPAAGETAESSTPEKPAKEAETASVESALPGKSTANTPIETKRTEVPPVVENPSTASATAKSQTPIVPLPVPTANRMTTFTPPVAAGMDGGQQEYSAAQDILKGKNGESALPEAVRLLWVAVEKGNSNAEVALAELYRQGRGVAKNCDQTKILLTAAAKKGNGEAQKRLEQFLGKGCE
jgi:hypothetical protein